MATKPARFTFLLDPGLKQQFEALCAAQDITPSQLMRQMIKAHLASQQTDLRQVRPAKRAGAK